MRNPTVFTRFGSAFRLLACVAAAYVAGPATQSAPATVLLEERFDFGFPGWTVVQPAGSFFDGPLLWQYDVANDAFVEQSNYYTDAAAGSVSRRATMLIHETVAPDSLTYTARLTAGDDDGFGLIFGYQDDGTFYRVSFGRQSRTIWPFTGWSVDRMVDGEPTDLFGAGMPGYEQTFVNTAGRPFDVTLVISGNALTLTVIDDPDGVPTTWPLVVSGELPSPAGGRVGMFSWGQGGGRPRGFRIQDPTLDLAPLDAGLSGLLAGWTALITPRADGTSNLSDGGPPVWSIGADAAGARNTLIENSDAFHAPDNNAGGVVHFAAPSFVGGDESWTDYIYSARFLSSDNDGFGMLLRFADEENFYRIGMRLQNSVSGVKQGLSIQKAVNRVFSEIAWDRDSFRPPMDVPIDLHASIRGNQLQLIVVADPEGDPQTVGYGPYDIADGTVDAGKVGVFSWAQYREAPAASRAGTEVDSVQVHSVAGQALVVSSPFGMPDPPVGVHDFSSGTSVTASVATPVNDVPGVRGVLQGWTGHGSVPASGTESSVTFDLTSFSALVWEWRIDYELDLSASAGGQVTSTPAAGWIEAGTAVTALAEPSAGFIFAGWEGDIVSTEPSLQFTMDAPITLRAVFQMPLRINAVSIEGGEIVLEVSPLAEGAAYHVQRAAALDGNWTTVAADQTGSEFREALGTGNAFYRLVLAD